MHKYIKAKEYFGRNADFAGNITLFDYNHREFTARLGVSTPYDGLLPFAW